MRAVRGFVFEAFLACVLCGGCEAGPEAASPEAFEVATEHCDLLSAETPECVEDAGWQRPDASPGDGLTEGDAPLERDPAVDGQAPDPGDPCAEEDERRTHAFDFCVWADEADLTRLYGGGVEVAVSVTLAGRRYEGAELELHGMSSLAFPKKSLRIRFPDHRPRFDVFGDGSEKIERLVLLASWIDPSYARIKLVFDTLRAMGALAPRIGHARVHVNGKFEGLFVATERIDEHFLERNGLSRDGHLYKAENHSANWQVHEDALLGFSDVSEHGSTGEDLSELFRAVRDTPRTYDDFEREIAARVDLNDFDLWHIVMSHMANVDTFSKNYYLYRDPDATDPAAGAVFRIIHWDADATLGVSWRGTRLNGDGATLFGVGNELAAAMYAIPTYRRSYVQSFSEYLATTLSAASLRERAAALLDALEQDIRMDHDHWMRETSFEAERDFLFEILDLRERIMTDAVRSELRPH